MKVVFTRHEVIDIIIATVVLTFVFKIAFTGVLNSFFLFFFYLFIFFLAVVTGFVGHELLHKFTAFRYNHYAEFRRWDLGLVIAVFSMFFHFVFAAPGATNIYGYVHRDTNGKIAVSGPLYNLILGVLLLPVSIFLPFLYFVGVVNIWLAFFNLLPIPPLDGFKVLRWNFLVYIVLIIIAGVLTLRFIIF